MDTPVAVAQRPPKGLFAKRASMLTLLLAILTPATVILGMMALVRPLFPPDVHLAGLGLVMAGPAVGVTVLSFGAYLRPNRTFASGGDRSPS